MVLLFQRRKHCSMSRKKQTFGNVIIACFGVFCRTAVTVYPFPNLFLSTVNFTGLSLLDFLIIEHKYFGDTEFLKTSILNGCHEQGSAQWSCCLIELISKQNLSYPSARYTHTLVLHGLPVPQAGWINTLAQLALYQFNHTTSANTCYQRIAVFGSTKCVFCC